MRTRPKAPNRSASRRPPGGGRRDSRRRTGSRSGASGGGPGVALLAALLAVLAPGAAAAQEGGGGPGFEVVGVDLSARAFDRVLPFDVPFLMRGPVPAGASLIEIRCWTAREAAGLDAAVAGSERGDCWEPPAIPDWHRVPGVDDEAAAFAIAVPRLEAERVYRFKLSWDKEVTAEEAAAFRTEVERLLDRFFWHRSLGDLDAGEGRRLREAVVAALAKATGADRFIRTDSLFDPAAPFAEVQDRFFTTLNEILEVENQLDDRIARYEDARARLKSLLLGVRDDEAFRRLDAALAGLAEREPDLAPAAAAAAVVRAGIGDGLRGPRTLGGDDELAEFLEAARAAYGEGLGRLDGLIELLRDPPVPGLSVPDRERLRALAAAGGPLARARAQVEILRQHVGVNFPELRSRRREAIARVAEGYETLARTSLVVAGSTTGDFATQHNNYVSFDGGLAFAPDLDDFVVYAGTNVYFRPVNKGAPLNQLGGFRATLTRRFALTIGLTVEGIADQGSRPTRVDLFDSQSLVLGAGLRLTQSLRATAGALVFKRRSRNPLSDDVELAATPFLAVSFDMDVAPALNGIGARFKGGG